MQTGQLNRRSGLVRALVSTQDWYVYVQLSEIHPTKRVISCKNQPNFKYEIHPNILSQCAQDFFISSSRLSDKVYRVMITIEIPKPITEAAAWKHEHDFVNTTTRWDNYPTAGDQMVCGIW
jgi:hypothetical protein